MTNRASSKQHCFVGKEFPSSKFRKRQNKQLAAVRRDERRAEQAKRIASAKNALAS